MGLAHRRGRAVETSKKVRLALHRTAHLSRVNGSHHIFVHKDVPELQNLQDVGGLAKPYQVRQFLRLVERYNLQLGRGDESGEQESKS